MTRARAFVAGGVACLLAGVFALLLAHDVGAWQSTLRNGDLRFGAKPYTEQPWHAHTLLPFGTAEHALGIGDDLLYRNALQSFRLSGPRLGSFTERLLSLRAQAQRGLVDAVRSDHDHARRAREANLLGVLYLVASLSGTERAERTGFMLAAINNFAAAVKLDQSNEDAKYNLELALQRAQDVDVTGTGTGGARGRRGNGAGLGRAGRGY